ncbi:isomerase YbhE [Rhizoctonia solani]|uniref:Isomerase YbhE n=1 Tax=Rhizoctonia solani TaxID=456999 RepID=A0A8H7M5R6_9AGAM|nr:isomerase YbhE [Rhizoctonia solani]
MVASTAFTLLVGAYSSVITGIRFDPASTNLSVLGTSPSGNNPSWIATHPLNNSIIVATNEGNPQATTGADPAYIVALTKPRQVVVMDYSGGSGAFIPLREDLLTLDESKAQRIKFNATVSHPHQALEYGDEVLIPDLGADKIWRLKQSTPVQPGVPNWTVQGFVEQVQGAGRGTLLSPGNLAQVPDPRGDTIAIFSFDKSGNLKLVKQVFTGLNQIRAMSQGGEDTQYIAAGGKEGGGLVVYEKINNGQDLKERARLPAGVVAQPASFAWL